MMAIYKRDLQSYFNSPLAWTLISGYLFVIGLIYWAMVKNFSERSMMSGMSPMGGQDPKVMDELIVPLIWWMGFLMMFIVPMLTMRMFAEERRSGTLEMLFTYPLSEAQIVGGKFLASMSLVVVMLAFTLGSLLSLGRKVPLEWPLIGSGYLGLLLLASSFIALGLWASSLTSSQLVAAVLTYGGLMMLWLIQLVEDSLVNLKERFGPLSLMEHLESMVRGNISSHDIIFYTAFTGLFLFLTARVLESRKWSS